MIDRWTDVEIVALIDSDICFEILTFMDGGGGGGGWGGGWGGWGVVRGKKV